MIKTCGDVVDALCNPDDGLLREQLLQGSEGPEALSTFWQTQWASLNMIYQSTERWSVEKASDRETLKQFCRDTMEFSERLFVQFGVFSGAITTAAGMKQEGNSSRIPDESRDLLSAPSKTLLNMTKWLRLRDPFLAETAVRLAKQILRQLTEQRRPVEAAVESYLGQVVLLTMKTQLSKQEIAELERALEANTGKPLIRARDVREQSTSSRDGRPPVSKSKLKASTIDLDKWKSNASKISTPIDLSEDEYDESKKFDEDILAASRSIELMKKSGLGKSIDKDSRKPTQPASKTKIEPIPAKPQTQSKAAQASFLSNRKKELEEKKRQKEALRKATRKGGELVPGEGTGLMGLGLSGKDHAPAKGEGIMMSSGSESESEDDVDEDLFGPKAHGAKTNGIEGRRRDIASLREHLPVKKKKQIRSVKDMRARLAPDLSPLHRTILSWEFFHKGDFPPGSKSQDYTLVSNTFRTPVDYHNTFEPLLVLEAWQGFLKSKEEGSMKSFEIKVANRLSVDSFVEISNTMPHADCKEVGISEADVVLISKAKSPASDSSQPHCLARVFKVTRKKAVVDVSYRLITGNPLISALIPNATLNAVKILSMTPLEREYGALLGLTYFDLCDEIIRAKPSPLLSYTENQLKPIMANYSLNKAQSQAVRSAVDNDAFTLIQG